MSGRTRLIHYHRRRRCYFCCCYGCCCHALVRPHYGESKRYMMYERIVQSAGLRGRGGGQAAGGRGRVAKEYEAAEVSLVRTWIRCLLCTATVLRFFMACCAVFDKSLCLVYVEVHVDRRHFTSASWIGPGVEKS